MFSDTEIPGRVKTTPSLITDISQYETVVTVLLVNTADALFDGGSSPTGQKPFNYKVEKRLKMAIICVECRTDRGKKDRGGRLPQMSMLRK